MLCPGAEKVVEIALKLGAGGRPFITSDVTRAARQTGVSFGSVGAATSVRAVLNMCGLFHEAMGDNGRVIWRQHQILTMVADEVRRAKTTPSGSGAREG